jgi:glucan 1,3-beta-glucosidase
VPAVGEPTTNVTADPSQLVVAAADGYWLNDLSGKGYAAFNPNPGAYKVFRNVRDYGAVGKSRHTGLWNRS